MLFLYILGKVILYIVLLLLAILLAVLLIPFKYTLAGEKSEDTVLEGAFSWLFGGLKFKFNYNSDNGICMTVGFLGFHKKLDKSVKKPGRKKNKNKDNNIKNKQKKPAYSYFTYEILKKALQAVLKMLDHCRPGKLLLNIKGGFEDPMYTGLLYGIQNTGFAISDKYHIRIQLRFEEDELGGNLVIGGGIQFFYLLLVAIEFVLAKPFRSILVKNLKFKIKRRVKTWRTVSISAKT